MLIDTETYIDCPYRYWRVAQVPVDGWLGDDDRTSALLILASRRTQAVPLPGSQCGVGNGRTIAWIARDDGCCLAIGY